MQSEEQFFTRASSGGTIVSSAYLEALEVINKRYHPSSWNVYTFHASDGDNFVGTITTKCYLQLPKDQEYVTTSLAILKLHRMMLLPGMMRHKISNHLKQLVGRSMKCVTVKQKEDIWKAFKIMFGNYGGES